MAFGIILNELRQLKVLTQDQLARILGMSQQTIDHYEKGRAKPTLDTLTKIADHFGVTTDYLVGKSPFKNQAEEKSSIVIATMNALVSPKSYYSDDLMEVVFNIALLSESIFAEHTIAYITALMDKAFHHPLTAQELYDIAKFTAASFTWPSDYRSAVIVKIRDETFNVLVDFWAIPKITIDENVSNIIYLKDSPKVTNFIFSSENSKSPAYPPSPLPDDLTEEELQKIAEYTAFLKSQRKENP